MDLRTRILAALDASSRAPIVLVGRSGSGKTTLLRAVARQCGRKTVWLNSVGLVTEMVAAIRGGRYEHDLRGFVEDDRIACVEHLEDLRGKPVTRGEVRRLIEQRAARGHGVLLTVTRATGDDEVLEWLDSWTERLALD